MTSLTGVNVIQVNFSTNWRDDLNSMTDDLNIVLPK